MTDRVVMPSPHAATTRRGDAHPRAKANERANTNEAGPGHFARGISLDEFLGSAANSRHDKQAVAVLLQLVAKAAIQIADLAPLGQFPGNLETSAGAKNTESSSHRFNAAANEILLDAVRRAPVAAVLSKESLDALVLDGAAPLAVAVDALDGTVDTESNVAIGTIFSVYPARTDATEPAEHFLRAGREQLAAGLIIYGLQICFVLTLGDGAHVFVLDRRANVFRLAIPRLAMPEDSTEFSVNASHYRHWDNSLRAYIDDCIKGADGPLRRDHSMQWTASFIADAYRILVRGGVFLDPGDRRHGHADCRLRLIYQANPIAFLVEQAGGRATNTTKRILDIVPRDLHAQTSIVFGSSDTVERISRYHADPHSSAERAPLFFQRGLIRR